jgi:hypothetical protein
LRWILALWRLHILPVQLLWGSLHRNTWHLHLELWSGKLVLGALHLQWHLWPVHIRESKELARLREAGPNIASRKLPMEWWFLLAILLYFLDLILNHKGLIDHVLEIGVISVEQLESNVIIQPIQEHVLLLLIYIDVIRGVSRQLDQWIEVLIHRHAALFQVSELLLQVHSATGHIVGT